ncbi:DUF2334 domain-containing protein [Paenibacillus sp. Cedars]|uniref:DUF2334 domain-containing protein n=1 Tax=Paenibacillus sp. Cedars TaxID=1980674 RepID=UPI0011659ADA|nr:DUF2334 domain-containing protein [Paenibacillus sp. Cedars]AWP27140.1 hypothetical protein B9D94_11125 [Paenibacillus sp. Cedars]
MNKALIRLEDIGPGGNYESEEQQAKLLVIAQFLHNEGIPFHLAVIPHYVDPAQSIDRSITDAENDVSLRFVLMLRTLLTLGASLGMHGYTHQYEDSVSGDGFEFAYPDCSANCPPDDRSDALTSLLQLQQSYAYQRVQLAENAFQAADLTAGWFETPHYTASPVQRHIIEICNGILYESPPSAPDARTPVLKLDPDDPFSNGTLYVPTPLYYVAGDNIEEDVARIGQTIKDYTGGKDLASFFYHPYLEFSYIHLRANGTVHYDPNSPLRRIIRSFKQEHKSFVPLTSLTPFIPDFRESGLLNKLTIKHPTLLLAKRNRQPAQLFIRSETDNLWCIATIRFDAPLRLHNGVLSIRPLLTGWPLHPGGTAMTGDYDGDGRMDTAVWYGELGLCEVALGTGTTLCPAGAWLSEAEVMNWECLTGDFDGDGRHDLCLWNPHSGKAAIAYSFGSGFATPVIQNKVAVREGEIPCIGDVNGDGLDDLVVWNPATGTCRVWLSSCRDLLDAGIWYWAHNLSDSQLSVRLGDVDGDGYEDLVLVDHKTGSWSVHYSSGAAFGPREALFGPWISGEQMIPFVGDLTGKGRVSLLAWSPQLLGGTLDAAINIKDRTMD